MQGLIPIIAIPPVVGASAGANAPPATLVGAPEAPPAGDLGVFQQHFVSALAETTALPFGLPTVSNPPPVERPEGFTELSSDAESDLVALAPPNATGQHPAINQSAPGTVATVFVEPASETSGGPETSATASNATATRPLQSVMLIGAGDVARPEALLDETASSPAGFSQASVEQGNTSHPQSRVHLVAETLPQGASEPLTVLTPPPPPPSNPETTVLPAQSPETASPDAVSDPARAATDRSTSTTISSPEPVTATPNPDRQGDLPAADQLPQQPGKETSPRAAAFPEAPVETTTVEPPSPQETQTASSRQPSENSPSKRLSPGNGPAGPFVQVPEDQERVRSEPPSPPQPPEPKTGEVKQGPPPIISARAELASPAGPPPEVAATQVAGTLRHTARPASEGLTEGKTATVDDAVIPETTVASETPVRPVEETQPAARVPLERESIPEGERQGESIAKVDATTTTRSDSELPERVQLVQRVAQALRGARASGEQVRLRLHPPELGSLGVEVVLRDGTLTARLEAVTEAARSLLLENLPTLRENLAQHGIEIDRFDVDVAGQNHGGRTGEGFGGASRQSSDESAPSTDASSSTESKGQREETFETPNASTAASGLDVMA